jgi:uncharacterized protein
MEPHAAHHLKYAGAVDADGHILEPVDLWERYLEPKYRDRALRFVRDEDNLEALSYDGKPSMMARKGMPSTLGAMGCTDLAALQFDPEQTYESVAPHGSMDAQQRLELLDAEGIEAAIIYTTVGLLWEAEVTDPELSQAYCRAYNRWVTEWCSGGNGRLFAAAHLSLTDPAGAATEIARAVGDGAVSGFVAPFTHDAKPLGHPDHDVLFAACQDLDVPLAIHPTFEPQWTKGTRMGSWENVKQLRLLPMVMASDGVRQQFTTLFDYGVFDKFPKLKILVLESGAGWIGYWLDRLDAVFNHTPLAKRVPLQNPPSWYFENRCWISCDPDENTIPHLAERFGADRFMWASDFPHVDHTPGYVKDLEHLASKFPDETRRAFLGDNARSLFKLAV